jgi:hypothetical protein
MASGADSVVRRGIMGKIPDAGASCDQEGKYQKRKHRPEPPFEFDSSHLLSFLIEA